jgi:hypothetical protein
MPAQEVSEARCRRTDGRDGYAARLTLFCWAHAQGNNSSIFAIGRAISRACRRDQSIPSTSAANCADVSRITPSVIGGHLNAPLTDTPRCHQPNRLDPVRSFRTEYVERSTEGIGATVPHQSHQTGRTFAEVDRCARYINLHARRDHALRTARITSASRSSSRQSRRAPPHRR